MPTIVDVAHRAQVSWNTVSRVINNDPSVRPPTRRAVLQAIDELGYVPNGGARALRNARTRTIGLILSDLRDPVFNALVAEVEKVVFSRGYSLLVCDTWRGPGDQAQSLRSLYERRVEGLLYYPVDGSTTELELFVRSNTPVLVLDWEEPLMDLPCLRLDYRAGMNLAVEYLVGLGHRRIALLGWHGPFFAWRVEELRQALQERGCRLDPSYIIMPGSIKEYYASIRSLLNRPDRPTALLVGLLIMIPDVLKGIQAAGLAVPRDVSVISIGDAPWAEVTRPPLTVLTTDERARGRAAAEYLFARLAGDDGSEFLRAWDVQFLVRESCAAPPDLNGSRSVVADAPGQPHGATGFAE